MPSFDRAIPVTHGDKVTLLQDEGEWLRVRKEDGAEGWVPRSFTNLNDAITTIAPESINTNLMVDSVSGRASVRL